MGRAGRDCGSDSIFGLGRGVFHQWRGVACLLKRLMRAMEYLHQASFGIGILGVLVIVFGVAVGLVRFLRAEFRAACGLDIEDDRKRLRHALSYYLLLGLEFMIASDIIDTLMRPNVQDLIILGAIVLIRTIISFSLNAELKSEQQHKPTMP